jgi:hypothetical protein
MHFLPLSIRIILILFFTSSGYEKQRHDFSFQLNPYLRVNLANGLHGKPTQAFHNSFSKTKSYSPGSRQLYNWFTGALAETRTGTGLSVSDNNGMGTLLYSTLSFNKNIKDHSIAAMVGTQIQSNKSENLGATKAYLLFGPYPGN